MNNDLISREALREDFYELEIHGTMAVKAVLPIIEERIDNLPAVDAVEVVHGRWMNNADDYPECNRCGYMPQYDPAIDDIYYSPYCPNCGARMDGDGNGKA